MDEHGGVPDWYCNAYTSLVHHVKEGAITMTKAAGILGVSIPALHTKVEILKRTGFYRYNRAKSGRYTILETEDYPTLNNVVETGQKLRNAVSRDAIIERIERIANARSKQRGMVTYSTQHTGWSISKSSIRNVLKEAGIVVRKG